jgi:hypothetical protein
MRLSKLPGLKSQKSFSNYKTQQIRDWRQGGTAPMSNQQLRPQTSFSRRVPWRRSM